MCGIAGIAAPKSPAIEEALGRMVKTLAHRGPDGSGVLLFDACSLGHTRLSIVDLGTGQQPMRAHDGGTAITFNGEIYGYKSIRQSFADYPFRTMSDTEVILALYDRFGERLLPHLPGMFAFALWDERRRRLFCARDRFGEKPFYYTIGRNGEFLFASEIKALLASGLIQPRLCREALSEYLTYLYVHPARTIYANIHVLPPGHSLSYADGRVTVRRYWDLPPPGPRLSMDEAEARFTALLDSAVERQLVADVPVGAFLSGGVDSSSIVALASRHEARLHTFSFGFGEVINELPYAREVADLHHTAHTELTEDRHDLAGLLETMQDVYDEPFGDPSNIPTYLIAKLARQHVKAVLTGDGGDELLGGYSYWYRPLYRRHADHRPRIKERMLRMAGRVAGEWGLASVWRGGLMRAGRFAAANRMAAAHLAQKRFFQDDELMRLGLGAVQLMPFASGALGIEPMDDVLRMDLLTYLPGDILVKIDRASMAHGLELRAPFLDVDFASFCVALPACLKIDADEDKLLLRRALSSQWPESVRRRAKQGFGPPVEDWLRRDAFRDLIREHLQNRQSALYSYLDFNAVQPFAKRADLSCWSLLVLAMWLDRHARWIV